MKEKLMIYKIEMTGVRYRHRISNIYMYIFSYDIETIGRNYFMKNKLEKLKKAIGSLKITANKMLDEAANGEKISDMNKIVYQVFADIKEKCLKAERYLEGKNSIMQGEAIPEERIRLPRLKYSHYTTGDAQDWTYEYTWEDFEAIMGIDPLEENSLELVREVYHKLFPYLMEHPEKLLEGGELYGTDIDKVRHVLEVVYNPDKFFNKDEKIIRKHWSSTAVFIDKLSPDTNKQEVPEEELLQGEMSAVTFKVGCYIVRSAWRIYKILELEEPADKEEVELVRKADDVDCISIVRRRHLRIAHEISAKHVSVPDDEYTYVCRADQLIFSCESIGNIYAVKENAFIPDEYASLLIYTCYVGSSFCSDTWYKLAPTGKITALRAGAYGIMCDEQRFTDIV